MALDSSVLVAAAAGAVRLVVSDELEEKYGWTVEYPRVVRNSAVVSGYPWMEREDVLACLAYARRVVGHD